MSVICTACYTVSAVVTADRNSLSDSLFQYKQSLLLMLQNETLCRLCTTRLARIIHTEGLAVVSAFLFLGMWHQDCLVGACAFAKSSNCLLQTKTIGSAPPGLTRTISPSNIDIEDRGQTARYGTEQRLAHKQQVALCMRTTANVDLHMHAARPFWSNVSFLRSHIATCKNVPISLLEVLLRLDTALLGTSEHLHSAALA